MVYRNEVAESGVGTIDSDKSASLATLHLQIGRGCQSDRSDLLEHRPDGTDAFDTLYIGVGKIPYREALSISISGIV